VPLGVSVVIHSTVHSAAGSPLCLLNYGLASVMGVPAHDSRDFELRKLLATIVEVISPTSEASGRVAGSLSRARNYG